MSPDPYRTPAPRDPDSGEPEPLAWYDLAIVATLVFLLGVIRVAFALMRSEGSNREVDVAWLLVLFAPFVVWKEIAAYRRR
jgi:hypothetical protein